MAGSRIIPAASFPVTYETVHLALSNETASSSQTARFREEQFLYYAHQDMVLDAAFVILGVGDDDFTMTLTTGSSGAIDAGTVISDAVTAPTSTQGTPIKFTIDASVNVIPAGNWIAFKVANQSSGANGFISLRLHSTGISATVAP